MSDIETILNGFIETKDVPNILLYGPKQSNKKSILMNFIHSIYKKDIEDYVLSIDCIFGTGIQFIRNDLTFFLKKVILKKDNVHFKSVILLNIDYLTIDAQSALRRLIEIYSYNTRFFVVINEKNRIIFPILSRFCSFYVPTTDTSTTKYSIPKKFIQSKTVFIENQMKQFETKCLKQKSIHLVDFTNKLYYKGVHCLHILHYIQNNSQLKEKTNFDKVRIELGYFFESNRYDNRDERILILFVLHTYSRLIKTYIEI